MNGLDEINSERNPVLNTPKDRVLMGSNKVKKRSDTFKSKITNEILLKRQPDVIISSKGLCLLGMLNQRRSFKLRLLTRLKKVSTTDTIATAAIVRCI